ncbi:MAG: hypothetical protein V3U75_11545 [Methylococcaceae bacterium]
MKIEYKVVNQISTEYLKKFVEAYSATGWECQGGVTTGLYPRENGQFEIGYLQAMVKPCKGKNSYRKSNN